MSRIRPLGIVRAIANSPLLSNCAIAQQQGFSIDGTVVNQRLPNEKYRAPNGAIYYVDRVRVDTGPVNGSKFARAFDAAERAKKVRVRITIETTSSDLPKLFNIERIELIAEERLQGKSGVREISLGSVNLGTLGERFHSSQQRVTALIGQRLYEDASLILAEMEELYGDEKATLWEVLKEIYISRGVIATAVRGRNTQLFEEQIDSFDRLMRQQSFKALPLVARYQVLSPVVQGFGTLPSRSRDGSFTDDALTGRIVEIVKWMLEEMTAYETTVPDRNIGLQAGALQEYFQSRVQYSTFQLKAVVHKGEGDWTACMDALEGYWRYSGLYNVRTVDVARSTDIKNKVRDVVVRFNHCLWKTVESSTYDGPEEYAVFLRSKAPALAERWLFLAQMVEQHRSLLLDGGPNAPAYEKVLAMGKFLKL